MNRVFIDMDGVIVDFMRLCREWSMSPGELKATKGAYMRMDPMPGAIDAVRTLISRGYDVWIATKSPTGVSTAPSEKTAWILSYLPELERRIIITPDKGLLGDSDDVLIDDRINKANCEAFPGTLIEFNSWADVLGLL